MGKEDNTLGDLKDRKVEMTYTEVWDIRQRISESDTCFIVCTRPY